MEIPATNEVIDTSFFERQKKLIDSYIEDLLSLEGKVSKFQEAIAYSLLPEGKRYRSIVACSVYESLGGHQEDFMGAVVAVECLHHASLIYDDLPSMDNSEMRKNKETVHIKFEESTALLAAIGLQEYFRILLNEASRQHSKSHDCDIELVDKYAHLTVQALLKGQELDLQIEKDDVALRRGMIDKNSLFSFSIILPVLLLNKVDELPVMEEIGARVAFAYQLFDDLRDIQDESVTGKTQGLDEGKNTLLYKYGPDKVREMLNNELVSIDSLLSTLPGSSGKIRNIICSIFTVPS